MNGPRVQDLSAAELLEVWESAVRASPMERALALLAAALPTARDVAHWPIGRRNAALLELRRRVFGDGLETVSDCPQCGATLEAALAVRDLLALAPDPTADARPDTTTWVDAGDRRVRVRAITSDDLLAVTDTQGGPTALLERCIVESDDDAATATLPEAVMRAIEAALAASDPLADLALDMDCPACNHRWSAPIDVAAFVWTEVDAWARRTLRDVHTLALAYGWPESDILALTPARRQAYLELVAG